MASNPDFLGCNEKRMQKSFFKVLNSVDIFSENMRAIPHDFAKCFSDDKLLGMMKIRTQWGRSWKVKISKNPRFYFMEKSGWETFVRDNNLGNEFLTFTLKGRMHFSVNIMNQSGKEILKPPQTRTFRASSRQDVKTEEVAVSAGLSPRGARTEAESSGRGYKRKLNSGNKKAEGSQSSKRAETERVVSNPRDNAGPSSFSGGRGVYERKLNFGDEKAEGSQSSKRAETERVVSNPRDNAGPSSLSGASFNVFIKQSYLILLPIPRSHVRNYMPEETTLFKINHPDGKHSWNVYYVVGSGYTFSSGWNILCWEYPVVAGDTCKFTFVNPHELILVVSKS